MKDHGLGERISYARKLRGMTLDAVAQEVGVHKSTIQRYEKGEYANPKLPVIESIARALSVNPSWLIGKSDKFEYTPKVSEIIPLPVEPEAREIDPIYDALNPSGQQALCSYGRFLGSQPEYRAKEAPKKPVVISRIIPLLGQSFAAGSPETPGDLFMQDYSTTDPHAEFAIRINGDSMEPYLHDGDIALGVKREPEIGEVGAWYLDGGFLVKQFCTDSRNVYLLSLNRKRADADETIWHDSDRDLRCVGTILMEERIPLP